MKTPPKLAILPSLVCLFLSLSVLVPTTQAVPVWQDESTELEKMILKQVEERKKEIEAQKAADAKAGVNSSPAKPVGNRPANPPASFGNKSGGLAPSANKATTALPSGMPNGIIDSATIPAGSPVGIPRAERELGEPEFTEPTQMTGSRNSDIDPNTRIRFNFVDEEWKDVIEWFADQVGFGVYFGGTVPPQGTFTYFDSNERTVLEALDFLNSRLSILQPPHVLVRNGNQLVLVNESEPFPHQLIATVTPDQLAESGKFEVVSCEFDLGKLTTGNQLALELREDVNPVHIDGFAYIASANRLIIREKVYVLERFKDIIDFALRQVDSVAVDTYQAQHVEPEVLLITLRPMLGFVDESNSLPDGSLSFSVQPFGDTIYLKGTPAQIDLFKKTATMMDVPPAEGSGLLEQPYFQTHRITGGDPEVIFQILQTILDGEPNVRMDQDAKNGNIYLQAPKRIHDSISDFLGNMTPGSNFDIIKLRNLHPDDAVTQIEKLLGLDGFEEAKTGPKLIANIDTDSIHVYGTPQELTLVRQMVERIDAESVSGDGVRRPVILIPMSPRRQEDVMNLMQIPGIMESLGRKNRVNLILPQDREKFRNRIRFDRTGSQPMESLGSQDAEMGEPTPENNLPENRSPDRSSPERPKSDRSPSNGGTTQVLLKQAYYASAPRQDQEEFTSSEQPAGTQESDEIGQTTNEQLGNSLENQPGYRPATEEPSVPNAPIEVRMTDQGIVITTQDLDAGVDLEAMIKDFVDADSEDQLPSFFYLQFRKVEEAKTILEHVLGLKSSDGGGGGGGIGGLLGGAVQNAVGGAAGDALGGLFGGGGDIGLGDDSAGALELEGENVRIGTDVRFNTLIITGATDNDIDVIAELIDYVDQPGPPQNPKLSGLTYEIKVYYRDPNEIKELIMNQLPDYFKKQGNATANPQDAQQQLQAQVANQIRESLGGGRGQRGGSSSSEAEQPKATLGVDEVNRKLLVTGPEFIYQAVYQLVEILDVEPNVRPYQVPVGPFSTSAMKDMLKKAIGPKLILVEEDEETQPDAGNNNNRGTTPTRQRGNSTSRPTSNPAQSIQEAIMNAAQRGGGGGGRGNIQFQGGRGGRGQGGGFGGQGGGFGGQGGGFGGQGGGFGGQGGGFGGQGFPGGGR